MFGSLLCLAAFLPAQGEELEVVNARATHGALGSPVDKQKGRLPGDVAHFAFDIKNMTFDKDGRAFYSFLVEIRDPKGTLIYKEGPRNAIAQNSLGGNLLPCHANMEIPLDSEPGTYSLRIVVVDRATKKSVTLESKGKVRAADFGLVQVGTYSDREGKAPSPQVGVVGETMYFNFSVAHFARDKETKQPKLDVSLRVLDDKGKQAGPLLSGKADKDIMELFKLLPMQFGLSLNRAGNFTIEITATDHLSGKTDRVRLPLRVLKN